MTRFIASLRNTTSKPCIRCPKPKRKPVLSERWSTGELPLKSYILYDAVCTYWYNSILTVARTLDESYELDQGVRTETIDASERVGCYPGTVKLQRRHKVAPDLAELSPELCSFEALLLHLPDFLGPVACLLFRGPLFLFLL